VKIEYIITFGSTNYAIKSEQILLDKGLHVGVLPLPAQISAGCGISLRVAPDEARAALMALAEGGVWEYGLHGRTGEGGRYSYSEIKAADGGALRDASEIDALLGLGQQPQPMMGGALMAHCTSGGCGAKIGPGELAGILDGLPAIHDENLLVGYGSSDDAGVYRIDERRSIVTTADFFPPMVGDPRTFGRIAAANALSDVYAMGGRPLTALNLVCFPQAMDMGILKEILAGGAEKVKEASAALAGGHSIYDHEPKYGLAVTGIVENTGIIRNDTPALGHSLILTKPLGTGIIMAALRGEAASAGAVDKAVATMERLNRYAAEKMRGFAVSACTDVTGFGLLAHALEMASGRVSLKLYPDEIPYIKEACDYAGEYLVTAAGQRNRNHLAGKAHVGGLPFALQELLFDPQTSGGLLICVSADQGGELLAAIQADDPDARIIGEVVGREREAIIFK
jgi:selenide,water dikinase